MFKFRNVFFMNTQNKSFSGNASLNTPSNMHGVCIQINNDVFQLSLEQTNISFSLMHTRRRLEKAAAKLS